MGEEEIIKTPVSPEGHIIQIIIGMALSNSCYIWNFAKAKAMSRMGEALFQIDKELMVLAHPCKELIDYKRERMYRWLYVFGVVTFYLFMVIFDLLVFGE